MKSFLKKNNLDKLEIIQLILADNRICTNELMEITEISRSRLKRLIRDINDDLKLIFTKDEMIAQNNQFQYYLNADVSRTQVFQRLKLFYLEQSLHFELIILIILGANQQTIEALCDHFFISSSYLYQLIREANTLLEKFEIQIKRSDDNHFMIEGKESRIRLFTFISYLFSYHGLKTPITTQQKSLPQFLSTLSLTTSEKELIYFVYAISEFRMRQECFIETMPKEIEEILSIFYLPENVKLFNQEFLDPFTQNAQIQKDESLFYRLLIRTFVYELDTAQQRSKIGLQLMCLDNSLTNFSQSLITSLLKEYEVDLSTELFGELMYYASLILAFIEYFQIDLDADLSLDFSTYDDIEQTVNEKKSIKTFYSDFLDSYQGDLVCLKDRELFFHFVSRRLNLLKHLHRSGELTVYIHYSRNILGEVAIRNKLTQMFNKETLKITKNIHDADIVISDCIEDESEVKEHFFFYDISNEKVWHNLFTFLQKRVGDRILSSQSAETKTTQEKMDKK